MVAEMVVGILYCYTEDDPFPEFPQIGFRLSAVLHDEFGNIKITGSVLIIGSIRFAEQRHCRSEMDTAVAVAVETLGQESRAIFGELVKSTFRQTEADLPCQLMCDHFPCADISGIRFARKFGDPEIACRIKHICLRTCASQ